MSDQPIELPVPQIIDGVKFDKMCDADIVRSALDYKPRPDDIFIATYPKCGTTWVKQILILLFRDGKPLESPMMNFKTTPFLEVVGAKGPESMPRPGCIKTHLPFRVIPWSEEAKYVFVARNPKDCCVSYYHHMKDIPFHSFAGDFNQFFELFIDGKFNAGDFFDHVMEWYEHRNDPNVLFMTFEEMKENTEASILKMASFIGEEEYAKPLREDPEKMKNILKYSSFEYMKEIINKNIDKLNNLTDKDIDDAKDLPDSVKELLVKAKQNAPKVPPPPSKFIRKGIIGDWKNYFTEEQSRRMDQKFAEKMKGTELENQWKKYM